MQKVRQSSTFKPQYNDNYISNNNPQGEASTIKYWIQSHQIKSILNNKSQTEHHPLSISAVTSIYIYKWFPEGNYTMFSVKSQ